MWTSLLLTTLALFALAESVCHRYEQNYYEDIGCQPEEKDEQGCPTSYDCSSITKRSNDKCHYNGQVFEKGAQLESSPTTPCLADCRCLEYPPDKTAQFTCANVECPEIFRGPPKPGCYRTYQHGKCCKVKEICEEQAEQKAGKPMCEYKGKSYNVGEKFYPDEEPCMQCICQPEFSGAFVEPFCQKIHCNLELNHGSHIGEGCVPVYYGDNGCCPIEWRCPNSTDTVMPSSDAKSGPEASSGKTCIFGKLSMEIGQRLSTGQVTGDVECLCRVPPHPVCIRKPSV